MPPTIRSRLHRWCLHGLHLRLRYYFLSFINFLCFLLVFIVLISVKKKTFGSFYLNFLVLIVSLVLPGFFAILQYELKLENQQNIVHYGIIEIVEWIMVLMTWNSLSLNVRPLRDGAYDIWELGSHALYQVLGCIRCLFNALIFILSMALQGQALTFWVS